MGEGGFLFVMRVRQECLLKMSYFDSENFGNLLLWFFYFLYLNKTAFTTV